MLKGMVQISLIDWIIAIVMWFIIIFLFIRTKKKSENTVVWKAILIVVVGLFSFSFSWTLFGENMKLALLPLGVWILYLVLRNRGAAWENYRRFAWFGFFCNYIFFVGILLGLPLNAWVFPVDKIETHIAALNEAKIFRTHFSAENEWQLKQSALSILHNAKEEPMNTSNWYEDTLFSEEEPSKERFPYVLYGAESKKYSAVDSTVFVEYDGQGVLVMAGDEQFYFRTSEPFVEEVVK